MRFFVYRFAAALSTAVIVATSTSAYAQDAQDAQLAPLPAAPPPSAAAAPPQPTSAAPPVVGPRVLKNYSEGDPLPAGYHTETRVRGGLIAGGAATLGALWFFSALAAAATSDITQGRDSATALYFPVVGPFAELTQVSGSTARLALVFDGIGQAAGAVMFIAGFTMPKTVAVRNDSGSMAIVPMRVGKDGMGLTLIRSF